ncbi:MAG: hypothetical protein PHN84_06515 [Desulfuromonadaceae bacterium]|nr:hypothetical protein [Desulfuromonadaceae bacterium]MDD2854535.1 hypothetical protein [Desulfuromonadaceae bacterium]
MLSVNDNRCGNIDQTVFARIDVILIPQTKPHYQSGVAFPAADGGGGIHSVETGTDILPTSGTENVPLQVEDGGHRAGNYSEALAEIPQFVNVYEF